MIPYNSVTSKVIIDMMQLKIKLGIVCFPSKVTKTITAVLNSKDFEFEHIWSSITVTTMSQLK